MSLIKSNEIEINGEKIKSPQNFYFETDETNTFIYLTNYNLSIKTQITFISILMKNNQYNNLITVNYNIFDKNADLILYTKISYLDINKIIKKVIESINKNNKN